MAFGVQLAGGSQEPATFRQRASTCLGRAARYVGQAIDRSLTQQSLTHFFYRHVRPIVFAANAGVTLIANRFVHFSQNPIATSILVVGGMFAIYLTEKIRNEQLLWNSIGEDPELVKICLEAGVDPDSIPAEVDFSFAGINLHKACIQEDPKSVKYLIEAGVDLQAVDYKGLTALMFLCDRVTHPEDLHWFPEAIEITATLIEHGIDLTKADEKGNTALHLAIQFGHLEIARKILQTGFNPNVRNLEQYTPLGLVCNSFKNQPRANLFFLDQELALIDLLVEYHADVNALGNNHVAALHILASADIEAPKITERLLNHHADPNIKGPNGMTPLIVACGYGNIDTIKVLLKGGADVHAQIDEEHPDTPHCTALDVALHPNNPLKDDLKRLVIQLLLEAGAQAKKYTDSPLLEQVTMKIQKKYPAPVLRFRETHGRFPKSVTQYT